MEILSKPKDILTLKKKPIFNAGVETSIDYMENSRVQVPEVQLLFSPFGLPFVPIEIIGTNVNKIIKNLNWIKDRNNPGGILTFELVPNAYVIEEIVKILNKFTGNVYSSIWGELGVDLEDLFKPMTLCQLWINGYFVMVGNVRSCIRNASISNTEKNVSYSISVDELGNLYNLSILSQDVIFKDGLQQQIQDSLNKAYELVGNLKGIPLSVGIQAILSAFQLTTLTQRVSLSDGIPLSLRLQSLPNPIGGLSISSLASFLNCDSSLYQLHSKGGQNSVWSYLKNFVPSPWMEFFTESGGRTIVTDSTAIPSVLLPGTNHVVARTVPYSNPLLGVVNPKWFTDTLLFELNALSMLIGGDFIIITDDIIINKSLGVDSVNQKTVFHANYTAKAGSGIPYLDRKTVKSVGPLNPFASGGIKTFGIREMFETIDSTSLVGLGSVEATLEIFGQTIASIPFKNITTGALENLLALWFRNQSRFREGTVTTKGIPYARAGMYCLYLPSISGKKPENLRDIGIYYIDSLSHNYILENELINSTTNLNLIRGVPLPMSVAQTALLLFDYEVFPPETGLIDGEYSVLKAISDAARSGVGGI